MMATLVDAAKTDPLSGDDKQSSHSGRDRKQQLTRVAVGAGIVALLIMAILFDKIRSGLSLEMDF